MWNKLVALRRAKTNEPTIALGDFNVHVVNDGGIRKGVIHQCGDANTSNRRVLLQQHTVVRTSIPGEDILLVNHHSLIS